MQIKCFITLQMHFYVEKKHRQVYNYILSLCKQRLFTLTIQYIVLFQFGCIHSVK